MIDTNKLELEKKLVRITESLTDDQLSASIDADSTISVMERQRRKRIITGFKDGSRPNISENHLDYFTNLYEEEHGSFDEGAEEEYVKTPKELTEMFNLYPAFNKIKPTKIGGHILESFNRKYHSIKKDFPDFDINEANTWGYYGGQAMENFTDMLSKVYEEAEAEQGEADRPSRIANGSILAKDVVGFLQGQGTDAQITKDNIILADGKEIGYWVGNHNETGKLHLYEEESAYPKKVEIIGFAKGIPHEGNTSGEMPQGTYMVKEGEPGEVILTHQDFGAFSMSHDEFMNYLHNEVKSVEEGFSMESYREEQAKKVEEAKGELEKIKDTVKNVFDKNSIALAYGFIFNRFKTYYDGMREEIIKYMEENPSDQKVRETIFGRVLNEEEAIDEAVGGFTLKELEKYFDKHMLEIIRDNKKAGLQLAKTKKGSMVQVEKIGDDLYKVFLGVKGIKEEDAVEITSVETSENEEGEEIHEVKAVYDGRNYTWDGSDLMEEESGIIFESGDTEFDIIKSVIDESIENKVNEDKESKVKELFNTVTDDMVGFNPADFDEKECRRCEKPCLCRIHCG